MKKLRISYDNLENLSKNLSVFVKDMENMTNMLVGTGTAFCNLHIEEDTSFPKWQQHETDMKTIRETITSQYIGRISGELLPLIDEYLKEVQYLWELCDERSRFKIERDHYYAKMEKLSQTGPGSDADLLRRNQEKKNRSETQLQMIEAPLLLRLQDYEVRHDAIVNYVFEVFMMIQKQCFTLIASAFTNSSDNVDMAGAPSLPLILNHGNRSDVDDVLAAITKQDATEREREKPGYGQKPAQSAPQQPMTYDMSAYSQPMQQNAQQTQYPDMQMMHQSSQQTMQQPMQYDMQMMQQNSQQSMQQPMQYQGMPMMQNVPMQQNANMMQQPMQNMNMQQPMQYQNMQQPMQYQNMQMQYLMQPVMNEMQQPMGQQMQQMETTMEQPVTQMTENSMMKKEVTVDLPTMPNGATQNVETTEEVKEETKPVEKASEPIDIMSTVTAETQDVTKDTQ